MEPVNILMYVSSIFIVVIGTYLALVLHRILRILDKIDRVIDYIEHLKSIVQAWEAWPMKIITKIYKKLFR